MLLLTFCYYCLQFREIEHKILEKYDDDEVDVVCSLLYIIYLLKRSSFCFNEIIIIVRFTAFYSLEVMEIKICEFRSLKSVRITDLPSNWKYNTTEESKPLSHVWLQKLIIKLFFLPCLIIFCKVDSNYFES